MVTASPTPSSAASARSSSGPVAPSPLPEAPPMIRSRASGTVRRTSANVRTATSGPLSGWSRPTNSSVGGRSAARGVVAGWNRDRSTPAGTDLQPRPGQAVGAVQQRGLAAGEHRDLIGGRGRPRPRRSVAAAVRARRPARGGRSSGRRGCGRSARAGPASARRCACRPTPTASSGRGRGRRAARRGWSARTTSGWRSSASSTPHSRLATSCLATGATGPATRWWTRAQVPSAARCNRDGRAAATGPSHG